MPASASNPTASDTGPIAPATSRPPSVVSDLEHFGGDRAFQVHARAQEWTDGIHIRVLDMTPVFAQMQRDQVGAGILRAQRGGHRVRIRLLSLSSRRNFGRFFRGFFPAAAQRLVELHAVDQRGQTGLHQRQLGIEEIHLRGLHLQIAGDTIGIAQIRQIQGACGRILQRALGVKLRAVRGFARQRVRHFPERLLDGLPSRMLPPANSGVVIDGEKLQ
ncbi:hypothetical protein G6F32_013783 [Rhizopus arrhizus]|nr:hypothetical protein G6F32_013783 [Rhizopus arrhizus]